MNATSPTLNRDQTWGSRNPKALHPRLSPSTRLRTCLTSLLVCVTVALTACGINGPQPARATSTAPAVDLCADTLQPVPAGVTDGKLVGTINQGRLLIGIEAGGAGGIAPAYIDSCGPHVGPMAHDGGLPPPAWGPHGTIVFDTERGGGGHLFRNSTE